MTTCNNTQGGRVVLTHFGHEQNGDCLWLETEKMEVWVEGRDFIGVLEHAHWACLKLQHCWMCCLDNNFETLFIYQCWIMSQSLEIVSETVWLFTGLLFYEKDIELLAYWLCTSTYQFVQFICCTKALFWSTYSRKLFIDMKEYT